MKVREESLKYGTSKKNKLTKKEEVIEQAIAALEKCLSEFKGDEIQSQKVWSELETKKRELRAIIEYRTKGAILRGEKLNYNSYTSLLLRKSQNLLFLAPEVQWALTVYRVCSIHVSFKCFEPCPYLVCHVTTIENV